MRHQLNNINVEERTASCSICGLVNIIFRKKKANLLSAKGNWRCGKAVAKNKRDWENKKYRYDLKNKCERCNFIPEHTCQLDIHHVDGDRDNNSQENRQTLCANCHRLLAFHQPMRKSKLTVERLNFKR